MSTYNISFYERVLIRITWQGDSLGKAIPMSTRNKGFYDDLTKIIFPLSSNIIKYAPYLFIFSQHLLQLMTQIISITVTKIEHGLNNDKSEDIDILY